MLLHLAYFLFLYNKKKKSKIKSRSGKQKHVYSDVCHVALKKDKWSTWGHILLQWATIGQSWYFKNLLWQTAAPCRPSGECPLPTILLAHRLNGPHCAAVNGPDWLHSAASPAITFWPESPSHRPLSAGHTPATACFFPRPQGIEWNNEKHIKEKTETDLCQKDVSKPQTLSTTCIL